MRVTPFVSPPYVVAIGTAESVRLCEIPSIEHKSFMTSVPGGKK